METDAELIDRSENDGYETTDFDEEEPIFFPDDEEGLGSPTGGGEGSEGAPGRMGVVVESERLVHEATHLNGTLSTYGNASTVDQRVQRGRVASKYLQLKQAVAAASNDAEVAVRQERTEGDRLAALRQRTARLEAELERLQHVGEYDSNMQEQLAAQSQLSDALATEQAQMEALSSAVDAARAAESQRDAMLLELTHTRRQHEVLQPTTHAETRANQLAAPRRAARERRAAERAVEAVHRAEELAAIDEQARQAEAEKQLDAARAGHVRAVASLRDRVVRERALASGVDELRDGRQDKRARAVVELKASTEAAASEMRSAQARRAERLAKLAKKREVEKAEILAKGGNPYMVFRQRDEDARLARERRRMNETLEANMSALQGRIVQQYKEEARQRETSAAHKAAVEEKAKAMSANGKEVTNNKFMLEMTKAHVTVLDPTSKERHLHPSKNMTVTSRPDWKFGLGMGVDPDVVDHYAEKYPQVTATATEKAEKAAERARRVAVGPGAHKSKAQLPEPDAPSVKLMASEAAARDEAVDELLEAETEGLWEADVEGVPGAAGRAKVVANPYGVRELSKLEKRYLSEAMSRQKANQIVKQVAGGKTWEGPAFLCKPQELLFADFEVGSTYELRFTLTNVSYTFNAFRPQPLPDAVASFFEVTHVPPGRMSAGVSAPLTITFTPKVSQRFAALLP